MTRGRRKSAFDGSTLGETVPFQRPDSPPSEIDRARMRRVLQADALGKTRAARSRSAESESAAETALLRAEVSALRNDLPQIVRDALLSATNSGEGEVMTRQEVARLLGVCEETVTKYVREEGLPCTLLGPVYRFRRSEVLAWLGRRSARALGEK